MFFQFLCYYYFNGAVVVKCQTLSTNFFLNISWKVSINHFIFYINYEDILIRVAKFFFSHTLVLDQYTYITILLISRIGILIYTRFFILTSALPVAIHGVFIKTTLLVDSYTPTLDDMLIATSLMFLCLLMFAMFFPNNSLFIGFCSQYHVHVYIQFHLCFLIEFD